MSLGGGTFLTQNKVLPGSYINFVSVARASASLSDRGYATIGLELDFGIENEVFTVTAEDFQKNAKKIFGYDYAHAKLKGLRDLFLNLNVLYAYRLNGGGVKASNTFATCKYCGTRGNDFKVSVSQNIDDETKFDVSLLFDDKVVEMQTVSAMSELVESDYVAWNDGATLEPTLALPLTNGTNGVVDGESHSTYLDKVEKYYFNILGCVSESDTIKGLYYNFTKRMREEVGAKFQCVLHNYSADYEGVINVKNVVNDSGYLTNSLIYWVVGAEASCNINKTLLNKKYDGEFVVNTDYTQTDLKNAILNGEFVFHNVGTTVRVLSDINSLVTTTLEKNELFFENQTIRVLDQIAVDIANLFNTKYLGVIPNDKDGRVSLWADIVKHHEELQKLRAIENFSPKDVTVSQGESKKAVVVSDYVTIVNAMAQLYMTVYVQ